MITIKTNGRYRPTLTWEDLTPKEQKECDFTGKEYSSYFRYRNWVYTLEDFMRTNGNDTLNKWDGYLGDSFFSGILVKYSSCGDAVMVGTYYS